MKTIYNKYREMILYIFFGGCTTIVNIITYYISAHILSMSTTISTIISWLLSVTFAYISNKIWVFESSTNKKSALFKEIVSFYSCRLSTGILDLIIMILCVDILKFNDLFIKIVSNIIVIILNYIASKLFIFKNE